MGGNRKSAALIAAAILQALPCVTGHGQVRTTWLGPNDGRANYSWMDPRNWSTNPHLPANGDTAVFPALHTASHYIYMPDTPVTLSKMEFHGNTVYRLESTIVFNGPAIVDVHDNPLSYPWLPLSRPSHELRGLRSASGFIKNGNGVLHAGALELVSGGAVVNDGTLSIGGNYLLPTAITSLTLNGGAVNIDFFGFGRNYTIPATLPVEVGPNGGTIVVSSDFAGPSHAGDISGNSTLVFGRVNAGLMKIHSGQSFSGVVHIQNDLELLDNGAMNNASGFIVTDRMLLHSAATANFNRIADSSPIYLRGGTLEGIGLAGSPGTEKLGPVAIDGGLSSINSTSNLDLEIQSIMRTGNAVLHVGAGGFVAKINGAIPELIGAGVAGTTDVGIIPWARTAAGGLNPLTVDGGIVRPLNSSEFITTPPIGVSSSNLRLTGSTSIASNATVNSLTITPGSSSVTLAGSGSLTIESGALFLQGSNGNTTTAIDIPLHFGSREAIFHTDAAASSGTVALSGPISGTGGLTAAGTVHLSGASTYTGPTTINGRLILSNDVSSGTAGPLGLSISPIVINSSNAFAQTPVIHGITYYPQIGGSLMFSRDLVVRAGNLNAYNSLAVASPNGGAGSVEVAGNIQLDGALSLTGATNANPLAFVISGRITGSGRLTNLSNVTLTGDNNFTGGVVLNSGTIAIGSNTALGSGTLWITSGGSSVLVATKPVVVSNPMVIAPMLRVGGNQPITFDGRGDVNPYYSTLEIQSTNTAPTTFAVDFRDAQLRKSGPGLLQVYNLPIDQIRVTGGTLKVLPRQSGDKPHVVTWVSITPSGGSNLDLTSNDLIIDFGTASIYGFSRIEPSIRDKRITTSMSENGHALGYADNAVMGLTSFLGEAVDPTTVLIRYTYAGDANLDGLVDATDLAALASHWQKTSQTWIGGDFNYDAKVDLSDLYLLASNWQRGAGANADLASSLNLFGLDPSAVPEPTFPLSVGAFSILGALLRRRNSHQA